MAIVLPNSKWMKENTSVIYEYIKGSGNRIVNPSLIFDKYLFWEEYNGTLAPDKNTLKKIKKIHFGEIAKLKLPLEKGQYTQLKDRKNSLPITYPFTLTTRTRLIVNHGDESIMENSIALHPQYGFPIIPGSAVKGVTRHYCEEFLEKTGKNKKSIKKIFGNSSDDEDAEEGSIIFIDAWPESTGNNFLETDVFTPHYQDYYQNKGKKLPQDNQRLVPINFLAVRKGVQFEFAIAPSSICREDEAQDRIDKTEKWITDALRTFGIGAKTGSSYGYFKL
ncbi:MAG: type III-B CRISPR module RAMP protein Cmr6 [Candidatus Latescibacterota bacterium]|nr:MAG: type III-B CRISPR module RAMP protein Cmr6 [Candidatus Latescibacterota bacterium]